MLPRWAMVIDLNKCTACQACVIACKNENNVPVVEPEQAALGRVMSWMELITTVEGEYPNVKVRYIPRPCMQCSQPPCVKVCPVYATVKERNGLVAQTYHRCIGCRYCTTACPYTVKYFNWYLPHWSSEYEDCLNPDVSVRTKGVVEKCTFCHHRLQKAKEQARAAGRPLASEGEYVPACVEACPAKAMYFGNLKAPKTKVAQLAATPRAFRLMEDLGTEPGVIYLGEGE